MQKADLVEQVAADLECTKKEAQNAVDSVLLRISEAIQGKNNVTLRNFGTFKIKFREGRTGRNPNTGEPLKIDARHVVDFAACGTIKEALKSE